jgi:hypothetical protein
MKRLALMAVFCRDFNIGGIIGRTVRIFERNPLCPSKACAPPSEIKTPAEMKTPGGWIDPNRRAS